MDRLRRDRAAALALRVAFPTVQHLRLELKFESNDLEHTDAAVARTASAGAGVLRVPVSLCRLRRTVRSQQRRQSGARGPGASGRRGTGVLRPACAGLRLKATVSVTPDLHGHGGPITARPETPRLGRQRTLAFTLPDFEAGAMKPDRLRSYARRKVYGIRCLR